LATSCPLGKSPAATPPTPKPEPVSGKELAPLPDKDLEALAAEESARPLEAFLADIL
jgi:hypothetical protein